MNQFLSQIIINGIPHDLIYFLLVMPVILMFATGARHVLGLKLLGIYVLVSMSYVLAFILRENSWYSLSVGAGVLIFIYFFSYYVKRIMVNFGLHYFSRISLVITMISILLLLVIIGVGTQQELVNKLRLNEINSFAVLTAVFLSEHFSSNQTQKGFKKSRKLFLNSLLLALGLGVLIGWSSFELAMFQTPYLTLAFMLLTFIFGKYKGIRINEILRFRDIKFESTND